MPIIYISQYDGEPRASELKYGEEIKRFKPMIDRLMESNPKMTEAEAYIFLRNCFSSVNTYSLKD